jgi:hypothetical protein
MKQQKYDSVNTTAYKFKILIKSSIAALSLGAAMLLLSCQSKVEADLPSKLIEQEELPTVDANNFEMTYTDSGVVRYRLTTPRLLQYDNKKEQFPFHTLLLEMIKAIRLGSQPEITVLFPKPAGCTAGSAPCRVALVRHGH